MQQPEARQTTQPPDTEILDPEVAYVRRKKTALWVTVALLTLSLVVLAVGLISATRTDNVPVAGYYPGITLSFGAFLGIVGIHLVENRRPMEIVDMRKNAIILCPSNASLLSGRWSPFMTAFVLMAAIIFVSIGVIASFFCAIVDGIIASEFIDIRPLQEDMCDFYTSGSGYVFDSYYTEMTCGSSGKSCKLKLRSNTCYCCYLYNCESTEYHPQYFEFTGVSGCWDVIHLHRLLWASVVLNVTGLFLGIIAAAILGAYKDMQKPTPAMAPSPAPPPHILYNPTQHMLTYAGFCPPGQNLPAYPNYPGTVQTTSSSFQGPATPQMVPEGGPVGTTCPSEETQSQPPSQGATQMLQQGPTQEAGGGFMLTPNAPVLFGSAHGPFEKPPPYAY